MKSILEKQIGLFLLVLCLLFGSSAGSPGDDLDEFQDCKFQCDLASCREQGPDYVEKENIQNHMLYYRYMNYRSDWTFDEMPLNTFYRGLLWDCEQNCDYQCQRLVTNERKRNDEEILQFHGKWPFLRLFGIQEVASAIFSLGNLIVHLIGMKKIINRLSSNIDSDLKYLFINTLCISIVTNLAWIFSTIFHVRDFLVTERLDYYFAGLTVLSGFHGIGARLFNLHLPERKVQRWLFTISCIIAYCGHVYRLVVDWLYTYNMQANITIGILQNLFLVFLCLRLYNEYKCLDPEDKKLKNHLHYLDKVLFYGYFSKSSKLYTLYPLLLSLLVTLGMSLEVFDFPPFFFDLIDAHSLWHLVTIVPGYMGWYDWMIWDIEQNVWNSMSYKEKKD